MKTALFGKLEYIDDETTYPTGASDISVVSGEVRLGEDLKSDTKSPAARGSQGAKSDSERASVEDLLRKLNQYWSVGDLFNARVVARLVLEQEPENEQAQQILAKSTEKLEFMFVSKIGDLQGIPRVLLPQDQILWSDLDHRTGFVLSLVDGVTSYQDILAISGISRVGSLGLLARLVEDGIVGLDRAK